MKKCGIHNSRLYDQWNYTRTFMSATIDWEKKRKLSKIENLETIPLNMLFMWADETYSKFLSLMCRYCEMCQNKNQIRVTILSNI